jgi:hypothetical protein
MGETVTEFSPTISKKSLEKKMIEKTKKLSEQLDEMIAAREPSFTKMRPEGITKDINTVIKEQVDPHLFSGLGREEKKLVQAKIDDKVAGFLDDNAGLLGLAEIQEQKKALGATLQKKNFWTKWFQNPDKVIQAGEAVNAAIVSKLRQLIENNVPGARAVNDLLSPLMEAKKIIGRDPALHERAADFILGAVYASSSTGGLDSALNDPSTFFKNFMMGYVISKSLKTTPVVTTLGTILRGGEKTAESAFTRGFLKERLLQQ